MDVTIRRANERDNTDDEMDELLDILVKGFGANLPDHIEGITERIDRYDLHLNTTDFGNAYGEVLAANGWTVVGFHTHRESGDDVDTVSVRRIEDCNHRSTLMYDEGDEDRVFFDR